MSASAPRVSVLVPNYNHVRYLPRRMETIFAQTLSDVEIVLLDDASTDGSRKWCRRYAARPGVRYVENRENSGSACAQWARGLALARGEYVWIAESDDWAAPEFLERMVDILDAHPDVGVAYCQSQGVDARDRVLGPVLTWTADLDPERWRRDFIASGEEEIRRYLLRKNTIPSASAAVFRRRVREVAGPLRTEFRLCGDWLHWMQLLARSDLAFTAEPLNYWRQDASGAREASDGTLEWLEGETVLREGARLAGLSESETTAVLFAFLRRCWQWQRDYLEGKQIRRNARRRLFRR